ncbi:MAG TPA: VWA domain-containing protein [Candidatus Angelobacter sp.]|nr:VWA domain-containing protein [Candidatus Angelobacter sp.]
MRLRLSALFFVASLSGSLWPQSSPPATAEPTAPQAVVKANTRLVIVDVVARDKKDQIVPDLQATDFKVLEDGRKQTVSVFAFQHPAAETTQPSSSEEVAPPQNVFRNTPRFKTNSALNVVLLDGLNTTLLNQAYVREQMVKFLEKLPQGQPVAIYALGRKLRLLQDFTTDLTGLKKIIQAFKGESSHVLGSPTGTPEVPKTLQGWAAQVAADMAPQLMTQMESFAQEDSSGQMDVRIQYTVTALNSLARTLAGYPGRKNLIWITEGVPVHIFATNYQVSIQQQGSNLVKVLPDGQSESRTRRTYDNQLALVANLLADAQVAVYPIDARGLVGNPFFNVANNVSGQAAMGGLAMSAEGKQTEELFEAHSNMLDIAEKTGGKAFYNRNNIDSALLGDLDDGSIYYTIGYYPESKDWNGKFRKIQVSVDRPGVKLRYRLGYFAIDRAVYEQNHPQQRDLDFAQALDPNSPVSTALQFQVEVTPPSPAANKVLVRYAIDPHQINFETTADGLNHARVDCAARVFAPKDVEHPVKTEATRIEAALKPEVYEKINRTWFPCELKLDLPAGNYLLRLAVRDNLTGQLGSVNAEVEAPNLSSGEVAFKP